MSSQFSWRKSKTKAQNHVGKPDLFGVGQLLAQTNFAQNQSLRRRVRLRVLERIEQRPALWSLLWPAAHSWMRAVTLLVTVGFFVTSVSLFSLPDNSFSSSNNSLPGQFAAPVAGNNVAPMLPIVPIATPGGLSWLTFGTKFNQRATTDPSVNTPLAVPLAHPRLHESQPSPGMALPLQSWTTTPLPVGATAIPLYHALSN